MQQLRWLKGDWEFGKYKLQSREYIQTITKCIDVSGEIHSGYWTEWIDVPIVNYCFDNNFDDDDIKPSEELDPSVHD